MRIVIQRTGGFAGIKRRYELEISESQLEALKGSVADGVPADANYPDAFRFVVNVEDERESPSFKVSEEVLIKVLGHLS